MALEDLDRFYSLLNFMMAMNDQEGIDAVIEEVGRADGFVYLRQLAYRIECDARSIDQADAFDQLAIEREMRDERRAGLLRISLRRFQIAEKLWRKVGLAGTPKAVGCLEGQIRMLEQLGDCKSAVELYDVLCKELSKYASQYRTMANRLNDCVETLIDDEAWVEAEKVAKSAYVASIQAWRVASHPFVQISLQNLQFVLKKLGKEEAAVRIRNFCEKRKSECGEAETSCHCGHEERRKE